MAKNAELLHSGDTAERRMRGTLGPGAYGLPDQNADRARGRLMKLLPTLFANEVAELAWKTAATWCQDHGFMWHRSPCEWAVLRLELAQELHRELPDPGFPLDFGATTPYRTVTQILPACTVPTITWVPFANLDADGLPETRTEATARAHRVIEEKFDVIEDLAVHLGGVPAVDKRSDDHYIWLAHAQVRGLTNEQIAAESHQSLSAVSDALAELRKLIGLDPPRRPGRKPKYLSQPQK
jgi:hypothetical protein